MPKRKQIFFTPVHISYIKDKLPYADEEYWWKAEPVDKLWEIPTTVKLKPQKTKDEEWEESKTGKKIKKLKLKYTQQEVKKAVQEDKESLKDVEKLEEHLEEDINKAEKKLKQ